MPYKEFFIYASDHLAIGAGLQNTQLINISNDAPFEILSQSATAISQAARVLMVQSGSGRQLQDIAFSLNNGFGFAGFPFHLPVSKRLQQNSVFQVNVIDESAAPNEVRLAFFGHKIFPRSAWPIPSYVAREAFAYTANFMPVATDPAGLGAIAGLATGTANIRIQDDADFELRKLTIDYTPGIFPPGVSTRALLLLTDSETGRQFMDRPVPIEHFGATIVAGLYPTTGGAPFIFRTPKLLRRSSTLIVQVRNNQAVAVQMRLTFHGAKLYSA